MRPRSGLFLNFTHVGKGQNAPPPFIKAQDASQADLVAPMPALEGGQGFLPMGTEWPRCL